MLCLVSMVHTPYSDASLYVLQTGQLQFRLLHSSSTQPLLALSIAKGLHCHGGHGYHGRYGHYCSMQRCGRYG